MNAVRALFYIEKSSWLDPNVVVPTITNRLNNLKK